MAMLNVCLGIYVLGVKVAFTFYFSVVSYTLARRLFGFSRIYESNLKKMGLGFDFFYGELFGSQMLWDAKNSRPGPGLLEFIYVGVFCLSWSLAVNSLLSWWFLYVGANRIRLTWGLPKYMKDARREMKTNSFLSLEQIIKGSVERLKLSEQAEESSRAVIDERLLLSGENQWLLSKWDYGYSELEVLPATKRMRYRSVITDYPGNTTVKEYFYKIENFDINIKLKDAWDSKDHNADKKSYVVKNSNYLLTAAESESRFALGSKDIVKSILEECDWHELRGVERYYILSTHFELSPNSFLLSEIRRLSDGFNNSLEYIKQFNLKVVKIDEFYHFSLKEIADERRDQIFKEVQEHIERRFFITYNEISNFDKLIKCLCDLTNEPLPELNIKPPVSDIAA